MMDMPTLCPQCREINDFADFGEDPNGSGEMICEECYRINDESLFEYRGIPKCCIDCGSFDDDDERCLKGLKLPIKKGSCRRQD